MRREIITLLLFSFAPNYGQSEEGPQKQSLPIRWEAVYNYRTNVEVELCHFTVCEQEPRCSSGGWVEMFRDNSGEECASDESRLYCCQEGKLPRCLRTTCTSTELLCPPNYRLFDIDHYSCGRSKSNVYCCRNDYAPPCFNTSCTAGGGSCPKDYVENKVMSEGCPQGTRGSMCCSATNQQLRTLGNLDDRNHNGDKNQRQDNRRESYPQKIRSSGALIKFPQFVHLLLVSVTYSMTAFQN